MNCGWNLLFLVFQQLVFDAVGQGFPGGLDDVLVHADGCPGIVLVLGFDQDAHLGGRAVLGDVGDLRLAGRRQLVDDDQLLAGDADTGRDGGGRGGAPAWTYTLSSPSPPSPSPSLTSITSNHHHQQTLIISLGTP